MIAFIAVVSTVIVSVAHPDIGNAGIVVTLILVDGTLFLRTTLLILPPWAVVGLVASSSCTTKEFTETPAEVENPCEGHFYYDYFYPDDEDSFFLDQWRGELRYTSDEAYIYIQWKSPTPKVNDLGPGLQGSGI